MIRTPKEATYELNITFNEEQVDKIKTQVAEICTQAGYDVGQLQRIQKILDNAGVSRYDSTGYRERDAAQRVAVAAVRSAAYDTTQRFLTEKGVGDWDSSAVFRLKQVFEQYTEIKPIEDALNDFDVPATDKSGNLLGVTERVRRAAWGHSAVCEIDKTFSKAGIQAVYSNTEIPASTEDRAAWAMRELKAARKNLETVEPNDAAQLAETQRIKIEQLEQRVTVLIVARDNEQGEVQDQLQRLDEYEDRGILFQTQRERDAFQQVLEERLRQDARWGDPDKRDISPYQIVSLLTEEVGEFAQAVNEHEWSNAIDEVTQVAAVAVCAIRMIDSLAFGAFHNDTAAQI